MKMNREAEILRTIEFIRLQEFKRLRNPMKVYVFGNCGNLYFLLKKAFPDAIPYLSKTRKYGEHIITCIDGKFYDIRGKLALPQDILIDTKETALSEVMNMTNNYERKHERERKYMLKNMKKLCEFLKGKKRMFAIERFMCGKQIADRLTPDL